MRILDQSAGQMETAVATDLKLEVVVYRRQAQIAGEGSASERARAPFWPFWSGR